MSDKFMTARDNTDAMRKALRRMSSFREVEDCAPVGGVGHGGGAGGDVEISD